MANARCRVVRDYVAQYTDPIRASAGRRVTIIRHDDEYPAWVWCMGTDGKEGWVPLAFLRVCLSEAVLLRDYDAAELSARAGEEVLAGEDLGGWTLVTDDAQRTGWIPSRCLTREKLAGAAGEPST
jgi:hypothetical protein